MALLLSRAAGGPAGGPGDGATAPAPRGRAAVHTPPATTRARLRGAAVALAQDLRRDLTVDWVNLRLDDGRTPPLALRDPFARTDERVDALLEAMARRDAPAGSWPPTI